MTFILDIFMFSDIHVQCSIGKYENVAVISCYNNNK